MNSKPKVMKSSVADPEAKMTCMKFLSAPAGNEAIFSYHWPNYSDFLITTFANNCRFDQFNNSDNPNL
jgi:hypothetical protein